MAIKIRKNLCVGCGSCEEECPPGAIKVSPDKGPVIDPAKCDECLKCVETCPSNALQGGK